MGQCYEVNGLQSPSPMQSAIKQIIFKSGLPLEIEVIPIASTFSKHEEIMSIPHRAQFYEIIWIQKGSANYFIDFESVNVPENCFLFVSKDRVKSLNYTTRHDGKILLFTDSFFAKSSEDSKYLHSTLLFTDLLDISILNVSSLPSLQHIFTEIETELANTSDTYQAEIVHGLLRSLLFMAERERKEQGFIEIDKGADFDYTVLFKDLLEANYKTLKSVMGYATAMHLSEKRLTIATAKTVGKSPKTIIDERIMLETKRLLVHTNLSIKEIGYTLGFEDPTYFIKYFRKHTNKTPIEFRNTFFHS